MSLHLAAQPVNADNTTNNTCQQHKTNSCREKRLPERGDDLRSTAPVACQSPRDILAGKDSHHQHLPAADRILATHDPYNQSSLKTLLVFACATALLCRSPSNHGAWIPRADSQPRIVSTNQQKIRKIDGRCRLRLRRGCRAAAGVRPGLLGVIASSTT